MDETSSLQPLYLDFLKFDEYPLGSLSAMLFARHFSQIKNLLLIDLYHNRIGRLRLGWEIMLLASQSLTTFDFHWYGEGKFCLDIGIAAIMIPDRIFSSSRFTICPI
jgi:hypothetical protein